jgi:hypothetical protein
MYGGFIYGGSYYAGEELADWQPGSFAIFGEPVGNSRANDVTLAFPVDLADPQEMRQRIEKEYDLPKLPDSRVDRRQELQQIIDQEHGLLVSLAKEPEQPS